MTVRLLDTALSYSKIVIRDSSVGSYTLLVGVEHVGDEEGVTFYIIGTVKDIDELKIYFSSEIFGAHDYVENIVTERTETDVILDFIVVTGLMSNMSEIMTNEDKLQEIYRSIFRLMMMKNRGEFITSLIQKEFDTLVELIDELLE